jgi:hypothetical protein
MCNIIKKQMGHPDEVRKLIREIYQTDADIKPDYENKKLTIYLHRLNHWKDDKVAQILCDETSMIGKSHKSMIITYASSI